MGIYRVNASRSGALRAAGGEPDWRTGLAASIENLPDGAHVCVMIHGFRYTWRPHAKDCACPHRRLFLAEPVALERRCRPQWAAWPEALGFAGSDRGAGLAIAFGWEARAPVLGGFAGVYWRAALAGVGLAGLLGWLARHRPDLTIDMVTHSLGARVALQAAARRPDLPFGRMIFLGAAEYTGPARAALARLATAGSSAQVVHVLSRANDAYDALFARLAPRKACEDRPLGRAGLGASSAAWTDLQLDHPAVAGWLRMRGLALARLDEPVSHWHFYADPGAMAFYRAILRRAPGFAPADLRAAGLAGLMEPRWARLVPRMPGRLRVPEAAPLAQN